MTFYVFLEVSPGFPALSRFLKYLVPVHLPAVRPAQDGFEPVESCKVLKLPVQRGVLLFQQPLDDHLLHIVV